LLAHFSGAAALARILTQPADQRVDFGSEATLEVTFESSQETTLQWLRDGIEMTDNERVHGTISRTLRISQAKRSDEGDYVLRILTAAGNILSQAARLDVLAPIQFTRVTAAEETTLHLLFQGVPGRSYRFEVSEDLFRWSFLTNSLPNTGNPGEILLSQKLEPDQKERFFRAVSQ
jgi:hypothetical protein